jgi:hypothetical protein
MISIRWETHGGEWKKARRERIAAAAMQGLIRIMSAAPNDVIARQAVNLADALIAELDKEKSSE